MNIIGHYPVMYRESIEALALGDKKIVVDCTLGMGSHALKFFKVMKSDAKYIGIDRDSESLKKASERLRDFQARLTLAKGDFSDLDNILERSDIKKVDAIFFDLGISTYQLGNAERGFSFQKDGPLDMRMDRGHMLCAYDLVNNLTNRVGIRKSKILHLDSFFNLRFRLPFTI